ncbi:unnamed protein product [Dracunculus medinensis]|uniref:Uncharacterized protein n=1 Tax=Dracunculus medinensis TaxID=318479 RepID=A0A0N4UGJ4_DRAME|nr:unnamed protein product [Dracunculus medinensis]
MYTRKKIGYQCSEGNIEGDLVRVYKLLLCPSIEKERDNFSDGRFKQQPSGSLNPFMINLQSLLQNILKPSPFLSHLQHRLQPSFLQPHIFTSTSPSLIGVQQTIFNDTTLAETRKQKLHKRRITTEGEIRRQRKENIEGLTKMHDGTTGEDSVINKPPNLPGLVTFRSSKSIS